MVTKRSIAINNCSVRTHAGVVLFAIVVWVTAQPLLSQERVAALSIYDHRPIARAAKYLEQELGVPVNYEDPEYLFAGDLEDVTERVSTPQFRAERPDHRIFVPKRHGLSFRIPYKTDMKADKAAKSVGIVAEVILAHSRSGGAGEFKATHTAEAISIVAVAAKNKAGIHASRAVAMEQPVSLPPGKTNGASMLNLLCEMLSRRIGHRVVIGTVPLNVLMNQTTELKAPLHGAAQDVLAQALAQLRWSDPALDAPRPKLAWHLLYDPGTDAHFLNLRIVTVNAPTPFSGTALQPLVY